MSNQHKVWELVYAGMVERLLAHAAWLYTHDANARDGIRIRCFSEEEVELVRTKARETIPEVKIEVVLHLNANIPGTK